MPKSVTGRAVDGVIRTAVHPALKHHGFVRKSRTWNRSTGEVIQVVNVQGSVGSMGDWARFYVNTSLFVPAVWRARFGTEPRPFVLEPDCQIRKRLHPSENGQEVPWRNWEIGASDDPSTVGREIVTGIEDHTLPWFGRISSFSAIRDLLLTWEDRRREVGSPPNLDLAVLEALMNNRDQASAVISEFLRANADNLRKHGLWDQWGETWRRRIEELSERLGLGPVAH
jgi:hypothetical protein